MKRVTLKNFRGNRFGEEDFSINLTPSPNGTYLEASKNVVKRKQKGDTSLTNLATMLDMCLARFPRFEGNAVGKTYLFGIDSSGYLYYGDSDATTLLSDFVEKNKIDTGGNDVAGNKVSILQSSQGDVLYTYHQTGNGGAVGRVAQFKMTAADSATVLTDSTMASVGLAADGSQKVYNLTDGSVGTITAVNNGAGSITCGGGLSGGSDNTFQTNDLCLAFIRLTPTLTLQTNSPSGSNAVNRSRQLVNFEGSTYVLNDNYLEAITYSGNTFTYDDQFLQLHPGYIGECAAVNGNKLLIGANLGSNGKLHTWNGYAADYDYKLDVPERITAIEPYGNGWVVSAGRTLYYTDGFEIKQLSLFLDVEEQDDFKININGLLIKDGIILASGGAAGDLNAKTRDVRRNKTGLWAYDIQNGGWSFYSYAQATGASLHGGTEGCIFFDSNRNATFLGYTVTTISNGSFLSTFEDVGSAKSLMLFTHDFERNTDVKRVVLELQPTSRFSNPSVSSLIIRAGFGKLDDYTWLFLNHDGSAAGAANLVEVGGGTTLRSELKRGVLFLEGQNGLEFDFISSIANHGAATEQWTLDNNQNGATEGSVTMNLIPVFKSEEKTLSYSIDTTNNIVTPWATPIFENIHPQAQGGRRFASLFWFNPTSFPFKVTGVHLDYEEGQR